MSSAVAGPSSAATPPRRAQPNGTSSPSSSARPHGHSAASTSPVKVHDSPLREDTSFASYGSGGRETDLDFEESAAGGDLGGGGRTLVYSAPRDRKGKGRAHAYHSPEQHRHYESRIPVHLDPTAEDGSGEDLEDDEDEEAEARRIEEVSAHGCVHCLYCSLNRSPCPPQNLAKWAKADADRRAALRRSSRLAPSPVVAPPALPGAGELLRKTSTILGSGRKRRKPAGGAAPGLTEEELELAAAGEIPSPVAHSLRASVTDAGGSEEDVSLAARRERRNLHLRLDSNVDRTPPADPELRSADTARSGVSLRSGDDEEDLLTPTGEQPSSTSTYRDPFSAPSDSSATTSRPALRQARGGSVFIENLPPLPQTPSSVDTSRDPFATPEASPVKASSGHFAAIRGLPPNRPLASPSAASFVSRHAETNPFIDVVVTGPTPAKPSRGSRDQAATAAGADPYAAAAAMMADQRAPSPAHSISSDPASPLQGPGPRRRRSHGPPADPYSRERGREAGRSDPSEVGWLSWLFCGCLRPENDDEGGGYGAEDVDQRGRTNPME